MPQAPGPGSIPPPPPIGGAKVVVAALSLGVVAVLILSFYIQSVKDQVAADQITVFVLTKPIRPGDTIKSSDWKGYSVPARFKKGFEGIKAFISEGSDDSLKSQVQGGKRWEVAADPGAIITHTFFSPPVELNSKPVEHGKLRIALPVKSKLTPGGLRPDMKVDVAAPMLTGGTVPQMMMVLQNVDVKAVGSYTLGEEASGDGSKTIRSFNTISIDVDPTTALQISTLEKMVRSIGDFELYIRPPNDPTPPDWDPGKINPKVLELINKNLPAK